MAALTLKTKNLPLLGCLFLWCFGLYILALGALPASTEATAHFTSLQTTSQWSALGLPLLLLIISGLASSKQKEIVVFWRVKNRLPGCRAFSDLARKDNRIDYKALRKMVSPWPSSPDDQNRSWYKLYSKIQDQQVVLHSHQLYLLGREATVLLFLFMVPTSLSVLFFAGAHRATPYFVFMAFQYFLCAVATQNFASRLVCNVLAISTSELAD